MYEMSLSPRLSVQISLTPELGARLSLRDEQLCSVCGMDITREDDSHEVALCGAVKYAVCSCCYKKVDPPYTHGYKVRYTRWIHKHGPNKT